MINLDKEENHWLQFFCLQHDKNIYMNKLWQIQDKAFQEQDLVYDEAISMSY